eukprot:TRINITY_DN1836_c0_g3_i1.p1 TRINITY_DN1836_c0_g3~~TRINITY_DN1836_c0_g3_i1.p1  ORF type:complete len:331 (-),score=53.15 TRINITY_DN1836_c0_g3_i1:237-1229(-)
MPTITAITIAGDTFHVDVGLYDRVSDLRELLAEQTGWPAEAHDLLCNGKELQDLETISLWLQDGDDTATFDLVKSRNISMLTWYNRWVAAASETLLAAAEKEEEAQLIPDFAARRLSWLRLAAASYHLGESATCREACRQAELAAGRYCLKVTDETMKSSPLVGMYMRKQCVHSADDSRKLLGALFEKGRIGELVTMSWSKYLPNGYWTFLDVAQGGKPTASRLTYQDDGTLQLEKSGDRNFAIELVVLSDGTLTGSSGRLVKAKVVDDPAKSSYPGLYRKTWPSRLLRKRTSPGSKRPAIGDRQWDWDEDWDDDWEGENYSTGLQEQSC